MIEYDNLFNNDLSRVCGGDPNSLCMANILNKFVPRMRG